jgi:tripartite-type tricarboxylate transporter receptor subunit TctC
MTSELSRRAVLGWGAAALAAPHIRTALAQPLDRTARIVLGFPPGGSSDTVARLYAEHMRGLYAPQVIVESRSGAGGRLALEAVKAATPDGTTLIQTPATMLTLYPHIYSRLNYTLDDFIPLTTCVAFSQVLVVRSDHPARNLVEFRDWAKGRGREVSFGTAGAGTGVHFVGVQIGKQLGIAMTHVPYRGAAPALQDLLAGNVESVSCVLGEAAEFHRGGQLRILGLSGPERAPTLPAVATYAEQGFRSLMSEEWFGLLLPARTPAPIVEAAHAAIAAAARKPELRSALERLDFRIPIVTPAEFAARIRQERDAWAPIVAETGFRADE